MQPESIEKYLSGFTFEYRPFCNLYEYTRQTEGFWRIDPERPAHVIIFYNRCTSPERQRLTKVHELFHFLQTVDQAFLDFLDELILNSSLPEHVVIKILERSTDKATVMFLMPNHFFIKKYEEIEIYSEGFGELRQKPSYLSYPLKQLYYSQLKHWQAYFREAIDNILIADPLLTIPISFKPFERYGPYPLN